MTTVLVVSTLFVAEPAAAESRRAREWHLDELKIQQCHRVSVGRGVTVAIVDSGIDANHPDLKGHVLKGVDLNRYMPAKYGWKDTNGHGTSMAGIIAAQGGGPTHAYGIAPGARILPIRVPDSPTQSVMARAIRWAVDHGADVINISLSLGYAQNSDEVEAVSYALRKDVAIVAAAGNLGQNGRKINDPADIPGVVSVTGTTRSGKFWSGSMHGRRVTVAAPAVDIVSVDSRAVYSSGYSKGTGTSAAAAIVSGVLALIRARFPETSAVNAINRLVKTARDRGKTGWDSYYGYGIVDPLSALEADVAGVSRNPAGAPRADNRSTWWSPSVHADSHGSQSRRPVWVGALIAGFVVLVAIAGFFIRRRRLIVRRGQSDGI